MLFGLCWRARKVMHRETNESKAKARDLSLCVQPYIAFFKDTGSGIVGQTTVTFISKFACRFTKDGDILSWVKL